MATEPSKQPSDRLGADDVTETIRLVKEYARQETLGPLRGWMRYVGFGTVGSFVLGLGLVLGAVGVLRLLQTETTAFEGPNTSILAYLITAAVCVTVIGLAAWQIRRRTTLQRKDAE
jgi:hypothetical protein